MSPEAQMLQNGSSTMSKLWVTYRLRAPTIFSGSLLAGWLAAWLASWLADLLACLSGCLDFLPVCQEMDCDNNWQNNHLDTHFAMDFNFCCYLQYFGTRHYEQPRVLLWATLVKINVHVLCAGCGDFFLSWVTQEITMSNFPVGN